MQKKRLKIIKRKENQMQLNKRVYGIIGISSKMSNWNADFTGYPKVFQQVKFMHQTKL